MKYLVVCAISPIANIIKNRDSNLIEVYEQIGNHNFLHKKDYSYCNISAFPCTGKVFKYGDSLLFDYYELSNGKLISSSFVHSIINVPDHVEDKENYCLTLFKLQL
ncbi:MAG: hypothetical protein KC414_14760 [Romboutsia sp.]|nr:hypothetical protein [Romboutsia sp.]